MVSEGRAFAVSNGTNIYPVDWANLTFIDLAKAKTPEGRAEQVRLARDATHKQGFFYVINHGLDKATVSYRSS
jgi:isopenicillin N synthase-like dioxygenase